MGRRSLSFYKIRKIARRDSAGRYECYYCKIPLTFDTMTQDHIIPVSSWPKRKTGKNAVKNLVLACYPCNMARGSGPFDREYVMMKRAEYARNRALELME